MTYKETTEYLFSQLPMFERQGAAGYKDGLYNTLELDRHFGHPHSSYRTVHVAGTNGKGSCSHTIAAFLQSCGYRVGLYTSPHLKDFRERIKVDGQPVSEEYVVDFVEKERAFFEPLRPSFFELTTAMAFKYFKDKAVDYAVVEVGLGGRLDCTNIITPVLSVVTNISFDHTQFLGDTLGQIAGEKAGIIKCGVPVVIGESLPETRPVFESKAREMGAPIIFAEDSPEIVGATQKAPGGILYDTRHYGMLAGELGGIYQIKNAGTVLAAISVLAETDKTLRPHSRSVCQSVRDAVGNAFSNVCRLTGLMGRWQQVGTSPAVVCDTGHNVGGWLYLSEQLKSVECGRMHIVFGMVNDKDIDGVLSLLPPAAEYYFTKPDSKRAIPETELLDKAGRKRLHGRCFKSVAEAFGAAMRSASADDFIFVGGSSYVVADFLSHCV